MSYHIHWHEGLFLQPHHLQRLQRSVFAEAAKTRQLFGSYPAGIIEAQVSHDELANFRLVFDRLRVVLPSGLEVDFPGNADLPSFDLKALFTTGGTSFLVSLAVPLWQAQRANAFETGQPADVRVKLVYKPVEATVVDENTGDNPKPVIERRLNARLITAADDPSDLEIIPLLRIVRGTGEALGAPKIDREYVPPCLFLGGSAVLYNIVRDLVAQVDASRKELVTQIARGGFSIETLRGVQFEQLLRLRTLSRFSARLPALLAAPGVPPFQWYLELRELHGELAALHPEKDEFDVPAYEHENVYPAFDELNQKIRGLLRGVVTGSYLKIEFTREAGMQAIAFTDESFSRPVEYFLAIKSKLDPREVVRNVEDPDQFKFMPRSLATRAIRGVLLKEERVPPLQLPSQTGLTYFRLNRTDSARIWSQIQTERSAVVRWPDADASDFQITLYMTLP
jgi:type VI secretion system ImpJ/VasE family protein